MLHHALERIAATLGDAQSDAIDSALERSLAELGRESQADTAILYIIEPTGEARARAAYRGARGRRPAAEPSLPLAELVWMRDVLARGSAVRVRVGSALPPSAARERALACERRIAGWLVVPLLERGTLVGALELTSRSIGAGFDEAETSLLGVAAQLFLAALRRERDAARACEAESLAALGRATAGVAHDVNNFLAAIRCSCDLLEKDLDGPARDDANDVRLAAERASAIVEQLVRLARRGAPHAGARTASAHPVDAIRELERLLANILGERGTLALDLEGVERRVALSPSAFDQLVVNLVSNASHAIERGGRVSIATRGRSVDAALARTLGVEEGDHLVLEVSDDGGGIDARSRAQLFEPYFTTRAAEGGSGIGLATVASIVESAGGAIEVESELGRGALFRVWLPEPRASRAARRAERARSQATLPSAPPAAL